MRTVLFALCSRAAKLALAALLVFAAFVAAMAWFQDQLLFPTHAVAPAEPLPASARRIEISGTGDVRLAGVHIPPRSASADPRSLVLGFGGNAWNGDSVAAYLHELYPRTDVVTFHYRGYRPSTGRPSAQALIDDAPKVLEAAIKQVKPQRTIVVGFSIGSGVAARLASSGKVDGLVLVTPFDSLKAVARDTFPWIPVDLLFRHEMNTVEMLGRSQIPVAIVAAGRDEIIPPGRTRALAAKVPNLVYDKTVAGAGHNDLYARADFHQAMREAFGALRK